MRFAVFKTAFQYYYKTFVADHSGIREWGVGIISANLAGWDKI